MYNATNRDSVNHGYGELDALKDLELATDLTYLHSAPLYLETLIGQSPEDTWPVVSDNMQRLLELAV